MYELEKATRYALQRAAREQMKRRLLADIAFDLTVCRLEGWDHTEYIKELFQELERLKNRLRQSSKLST